MNGGSATANQVRDREKGLKQKFLEMRALYKIFLQAISPVSVAPDNLGVRVRSKHTPYLWFYSKCSRKASFLVFNAAWGSAILKQLKIEDLLRTR